MTVGRCHREAEVKEESKRMLEVSRCSLMRNNLWTVSHREGEQNFALMQKTFPLLLPPPPHRVDKVLDYDERREFHSSSQKRFNPNLILVGLLARVI